MAAPSSDPDDMADTGDIPSGFNPLQILAARWPFLVAGLAVGALIGWLLHINSPPVYEAAAQVLVVKKRTEVVKSGDARVEAVEDYVATQVALIKSEKIRVRAAELALTNGLGLSPTLPTDSHALAGVIAWGLGVARDKDSSGTSVNSGVLYLTFRGGNSVDCRTLLDAVIRAHQGELFSIYEKATVDKLDQLNKVLDAVQKRRERADQDRLGALSELQKITSEDVAALRTRVGTLKEQVRTLAADRITLGDQIAMIRETGDDPRDRLLTLSHLTAQFRSPTQGGTTGPTGEAAALLAELKGLEARQAELVQSGVGRDHPRRLAVAAKIEAVKVDMSRPAPPDATAITPKPLDPARDELSTFGKWLERKKVTNEELTRTTADQLKDDESKLKEANVFQNKIDAFTSQIGQYDAEIKRIDADKSTTQATQGAGGFSAEPITPPGNGYQIAPVFVRSMVTGLMIGLVLGAVSMLLAEVSDKSFRSPAEVRLRLGYPIIGHIPLIPPSQLALSSSDAETPMDPVLAAALRPTSAEAEAFRGLRTQLFFGTQGKGHQVIQVTSPSPGDGKSSLAANLAISLAQSGKRVVLIDCDLRKPRAHKLFGIPAPENGVAGIISGNGTLTHELRPSGQENLDVLLCGPRPASPAELLSSEQFHVLLSDLRGRYDFVIVDTPPVLAVADPTIIAPWVDGVLLVIRMTKKARPIAERARERLAGVGANVLGVILNVTDRKLGVYGYGYGYGYGYKYVYGDYQYVDSYHDDKSSD